MKDILYEESAIPTNSGREAKIYNILNVAGIVFFAIAIILMIPALPAGWDYLVGDHSQQQQLNSFLSAVLFAMIFVVCGVIFMLIKKRFNVVYDYTFVSGEIRISKVTGNKRKYLYVITPREISRVGKTSDSAYASYQAQRIRELKFTSNKFPQKGKDFYYFYCNDSMGKKILILECREEMIRNLSNYVSRGVLE